MGAIYIIDIKYNLATREISVIHPIIIVVPISLL